jgi:hypothetical protein
MLFELGLRPQAGPAAAARPDGELAYHADFHTKGVQAT